MQTTVQSNQGEQIPDRRIALWNIAVVCLILSGLVVVTSRTIADPDLWGHVRFGLDTIQNRGVMRNDPYSYLTAGQPWFNHEWLAEVTFAMAWLVARATGLVVLKTSLWVLAYLLLYWNLVKHIKSHLRVGIILFLSMTLTFPFFITIRPQSFTAVLYVLVLISIMHAEGKIHFLWICPLIFAVWPNLHGAFIAGFGILYLWAALYLLTHRTIGIWKQVFPPLLLSGLALLVNPYGIDLLTFLFQNLADSRLEIIEWQPMQIHSLTGAFFLLWIAIILSCLIFSRKPRNPRFLILLVITAYLPFMALRYTLFFILTAVLVAGEHIGDTWERLMPLSQQSARRTIGAPVLTLITAMMLLAWKWTNFNGIPIKNPEYYPIAAVSILNQSQIIGNLAVHFDWGDYALWHLAPEIKVSLDTRREMAYSEVIYKENVRNMTGIGDWSALLDDHPTQIALVKSASPTDNLMKLHVDWIEIYRDEVSVLFSHKDYVQREQLLRAVTDYELLEVDDYFP
mgnify:CR=1 FL=1